MTAFVVAVVLTFAAAAAVGVRVRLAAADGRRVELDAFRVRLGVPADCFRIVDDGPLAAWRVRRAVPQFRQVHARSQRPCAVEGAAVRP